ncbi:hypothetical protein [Siminovitchia sp. FSL W7-1587]|uniref:hypothetical protein n=1 Tax=Siminovitchia sp. FSL W7-1587 TaxID=2954699 RepID=UPI0030CC79AB
MYVQFSVGDDGYVDGLSAAHNLALDPSLPYLTEMTQDEFDYFFNRSHLFYVDNGVLTDDQKEFVIKAQQAKKHVKAYLVDPCGHIVDIQHVPEDETDRYIIEPIPEGVVNPRWDGEKWVSGEVVDPPTVEELQQENERLKKENEVNAMAVMELAEIMLNGGGK